MKCMHITFVLTVLCFVISVHANKNGKKHRYKPFKTQQLRIADVNRQLREVRGCAGDVWEQRKRIIKNAIEQRKIHPDAITIEGSRTPLLECLFFGQNGDDNFAFAQFLLKKGANAPAFDNRGLYPTPILSEASTVRVANLLVQHGAGRLIRSHGPEILCKFWQVHEPALIPFYVTRGANPNQHNRNGEVPLMHVIFRCDNTSIEKVKLFMQAGAILKIKNKNKKEDYPQLFDCTVPQFLKKYLGHAENHLKKEIQEKWDDGYTSILIDRLKQMRTILIDAQQKRDQNTMTQDLTHFSYPYFPKNVSSVIVDYAIENTYEKLENEPCPDQDQKSDD